MTDMQVNRLVQIWVHL